MRIRILTYLFLLISFGILAQESVDSIAEESIKKESNAYGVFAMFDGKPGKAALYSLMVPGGGQLFNKRYWKAPIVWAVEGAAIYQLIRNIQTFRDRDRDYQRLINEPNLELFGYTNAADFKPIRDNARQNMEFMYVTVIVVHIINIADAFVDRHLIEFDIEDDISLQLRPSTHLYGASVVLEF